MGDEMVVTILLVALAVVLAVGWWDEWRTSRRLRAERDEARADAVVLREWYQSVADQVKDTERRLDRLQRDVDGAGVLVVPGHALAAPGNSVKLFLN